MKGGDIMQAQELKEVIKQKKIDKRTLAKKLGITYSYLTQMLNGFAAMKKETQEAIEEEIKKGKK
jgi:transcriptional regulator with XRE-family HTH domain